MDTMISTNPLRQIGALGQSVWLDFLSRPFLRQGGLERLMEQDGLGGVTSNPAIFEKAIAESDAYDAQIEQAVASGYAPVTAIFEELAISDIRNAADVLRQHYDATDGRDGFVSLEVSPYLAMDTEGTIAEARRLWRTVGRENLMVKVPATAAGLPAIRTLIGEGININITLLFSQHVYEEVVEAYLAGLEDLAARGGTIDRVASVASFFVSRIDGVIDKLIEARLAHAIDPEQRAVLESLRGQAAIANARLAYQRYGQRFAGPRWQKLVERGARPQRLLWASTSTKNPAYRDVLYAESLIGPDTVDTMPQATLDAFRDHGIVAPTLERDIDAAERTLANLEGLDISLTKIAADLVVDGVRQFSDAFDRLLAAVAAKRQRLLGPALNSQAIALGEAAQKEVDRLADEWRAGGHVRRLWRRDAGLWTGRDESRWLGWLDVVDGELQQVEDLQNFAEDVRGAGFRDILLLGMGGSSLGPEVIARSLGAAAGWPALHVLDSTDPQQVRTLEARVDLMRTLFIVSSKSGTTLEPNVFLDYFHARVSELVGPARAGERFIAITDPGSALIEVAEQRAFRRIFLGRPDIGGRYSVLSNFGMVPLAGMGGNAEGFLEQARTMVRACGPDVPPAANPGVALGLAMGVLGRAGRDKVTMVTAPGLADFGAWAEQLIAESTGKEGVALIPLDGEPLGDPTVYGEDRLFVQLRQAGAADPGQDEAIEALERAGHPVVRISVADPTLIGQEFFRFEIATAVAGAVLGINPFDQPDVEASKVATRALTDAAEKRGLLPMENAVFRKDGIALYTDEANERALRQGGADATLASWLKAHFGRINAGDYFALLAYVESKEAHHGPLQAMRLAVRDHSHVATCLGYGPRFLHSTGQAYKGGPNTGVFLQVTTEDPRDLTIPGRKASFSTVKAAQARGDFHVLAERGRRVLRAHLRDPGAGLAVLQAAAREALS
jgi:transaldolase / glucose-6-phosphate isomerase